MNQNIGTIGQGGVTGNVTGDGLNLRAPSGFYEVDCFAGILRADPISVRLSVNTAGSHAANAVEIRRADRRRAAEGRRLFTSVLPQAQHYCEVIARLGSDELQRVTVPKNQADADGAIAEVVRYAALCGKALQTILDQRAFVKLPGGVADVDRLCIVLIERLEMVWSRATGGPVPRSATGPFVSFVAAAWTDLGLPEFRDRDGQPRPTLDAIGSRITSPSRREPSHRKKSRRFTNAC